MGYLEQQGYLATGMGGGSAILSLPCVWFLSFGMGWRIGNFHKSGALIEIPYSRSFYEDTARTPTKRTLNSWTYGSLPLTSKATNMGTPK